MGGIVSISDLKELESKIFGSTNQKSRVRVLSITDSRPSQIDIQSDLRYLWFSIHIQKRSYQRLQCYPPETKFKIVLRSDDEDSLKIALGCL
jgi:CRISPR type III-B/RAMP module RAMP protein Cmr1